MIIRIIDLPQSASEITDFEYQFLDRDIVSLGGAVPGDYDIDESVLLPGPSSVRLRAVNALGPGKWSSWFDFVIATPLSFDSVSSGTLQASGSPYALTLFGESFDATCTVQVSGSGVTFTPSSFTFTDIVGNITAAQGAALGLRNITITKGAESVTLSDAIEVIAPVAALTVTGIAPNTLPQNTTRNYTITGTGFVSGAAVTISGTGVTVNSTSFVNSTQLTANITVSAGAAVGARNVTVTNPNLASSTLNNGASVTVDTTIIIDEAWLTANGPAPYNLLTSGATYLLDTDVTTPTSAFLIGAPNVTLDLNGHTITFGTNNVDGVAGSIGVRMFNFGTSPPGATRANNPTIRNGAIIHGASGDTAYGIFLSFDTTMTIDDMRIFAAGKDSRSIIAQYAEVSITDSLCETDQQSTFNRHQGPSNVIIGKLITRRSVYLGGNSGIHLANITGSDIKQCVISCDGYATNGYGMFMISGGHLVEDNIIIPTNGRGVNAGGDNSIIRNNLILHWELPNQEFGTALNPPAIRVRWNTRNTLYEDNYSLGIGGGDLTSASSIYLSVYANHPDYPSTVNRFKNNECAVILTSPPTGNSYAQPLTMELHGTLTATGSLDEISGNNFRSNTYMVRTDGWDGRARQAEPLRNNQFYWTTGNDEIVSFNNRIDSQLATFGLESRQQIAADALVTSIKFEIAAKITNVDLQVNRAFWYLKYANASGDFPDQFAAILDSTFGPGVDSTSFAFQSLTTGAVSLKDIWTYNYQLLDDGTPVPNSEVAVSSNEGDVFSLQSDENGFVDVPIVRFEIVKAAASGAAVSVVTRLSTTLTVQGYSPWTLIHGDL